MVSLLFGFTVNVYGIALLVDPAYPKWVGGLAIVGGVLTTVAGVVIAYTGLPGRRWLSACRLIPSFWHGCSLLECSCGGEEEAGRKDPSMVSRYLRHAFIEGRSVSISMVLLWCFFTPEWNHTHRSPHA